MLLNLFIHPTNPPISNPPITKLVFYKDKDNTLYIMNISAIDGRDFNVADLIKI
jgi:hypothetical protein